MSGCPCKKGVWWTYVLLGWVVSPAFGWYGLRRLRSGTSWKALREWTGRFPLTSRCDGRQPRFWVHAVSVGEMMTASRLLIGLRKRWPDAFILVTTVTATGRQTARKAAAAADEVFFLPFDLWPFPDWAMRRIGPDALLLIETELWGNLLHSAKRWDVGTVWVNGRISDATYARARRGPGKWVYRWLLSHLDLCLMRTDDDRQRLVEITGDPLPIEVTGDLKLDRVEPGSGRHLSALRQSLGIAPDDLVFVAGSTHPGEEEILFRSYRELVRKFPSLRLIVAPRHIDRAEEVRELVRKFGLKGRLRTEVDKGRDGEAKVVILNTVGELAQVYGTATVSFVGGSLVPRGGHNLMEPTFFGVPVLFGPYIDNFRFHGRELVASGGGFLVRNGADLTRVVDELLTSEHMRTEIAIRARQLLSRHRGATDRVVARVEVLMEAKRRQQKRND